MATVTIRSKQSNSSPGTATIASVVAHDTVVFIMGTGNTCTLGTPTVGGVSMTFIGEHPVIHGSGDGGGFTAAIWYLKNASGGAVGSSIAFNDNATFSFGSGNFLSAIYVLSNVDTVTQPSDFGGGESTNADAAGPFDLSVTAGDMIISVIASGVGPQDQDSMTNDYSGGSNLNIYHKSVGGTGSDGPTWTFDGGLSTGYAFFSIAVKEGTPPAGNSGNFMTFFGG